MGNGSKQKSPDPYSLSSLAWKVWGKTEPRQQGLVMWGPKKRRIAARPPFVVFATKLCKPRLHFSRKDLRAQRKDWLAFSFQDLLSITSLMAPPPAQPLTAACSQQQIDAIELLLEDLGSVDPMLQHRASFQSCWRELSQLRDELVSLLVSRRRSVREASSATRWVQGGGD